MVLNIATLNKEFQNYLSEEINREATLLQLVTKRPERKANVDWTVNVGGALAEGLSITANAPSASHDKILPAQLPMNSGSLQSRFTVNEKEIIEAAEQVSVDELRDVIRAYMSSAIDELMNGLNKRLYSGDGSVADGGIYGLSTAISDKDYAGISADANPLWRASVIDAWDESNGASDKRGKLTTNMFLEMEQLIRYRGGSYNTLVTSPAIMTEYKKLFEENRSYQIITMDGSRNAADLGFRVAGYAGKPIIDDAFCSRVRGADEAAITSALGTDIDEGVIYFLNMRDLRFMSAPTEGSTARSGVYTQTELLAKNALYVNNYVTGVIPQLMLRTRKNCGVIKNIKYKRLGA